MRASNTPKRKTEMEITVENLQKAIPLKPKPLSRLAEKILLREKVKDANLSLVFVSASKIKSLNKKFLKRSHATDVLAFNLGERSFTAKGILSGEIIISTDAARQNARTYKTSLEKELALYVIHGILHLLGYDDHGKAKTRLMRKKEAELLRFLRI